MNLFTGKPGGRKRIYQGIITIISVFFIGWGSTGHRIINYNTLLSAYPDLQFFNTWADSLEEHASDADERKSWDPSESNKHYIDIDNYPEFNTTGTIPQNWDSIIAIHGYSFVMDQGILPWAIINTADSIRAAFEAEDMHKAMLLSADIGHYIADAHQPLHITRNYNGQYTGQTGVHSRYESTLINNNQGQITYPGDSLLYIDNMSDFVFNMIYDNYQYLDSVLYADSAAEAFAGNHNTSAYYTKFWQLAKGFTIHLFEKASWRIASVIYTEWINAGNPPSGVYDPASSTVNSFNLLQNYPNPFNPSTTIKFTVPSGTHNISIDIYNSAGEVVSRLINAEYQEGEYQIRWDASARASGIYFVRLTSENHFSVRKMLLLK